MTLCRLATLTVLGLCIMTLCRLATLTECFTYATGGHIVKKHSCPFFLVLYPVLSLVSL